MVVARIGKPAIIAAAMMAVFGLAACSSGSDPAPRPSLVTAKPAGGAPGKGPLIVSSPALHRGKKGSQKAVLSDRTLVITSAATRPAANRGSILVDIRVVIRNTSAKPVQNKSAFFELLGPEGDAFSPQSSRPADFYRSVAAHGSRRGMITFEIPAAAASDLYLLYRPEIATETVLIRLKTG